MNGEQKPLKKTLSLMGMDILDDETRKKLNGMMRQAIQADAAETAPAKYMVVSGLTSYCVGAWLLDSPNSAGFRNNVLLRGRVALQPLGGLERALCRGRGHGRVVGRVHLV